MDLKRERRGSPGGVAAALALVLVVAILATALAVAGCAGQAPSGPATAPAPTPASPTTAATPAPTPSPSATPTATPLDVDDESGVSLAPGASFSPGPTGLPVGSTAPGSTADRLPGEPDPVLTPGALNPAVTQATIGSTICVSGWTATIRPPSSYTTNLKKQQIVQYTYTDTSTADYEEDHLISLELGGAPTDPRNLWPEPYTASLPDGRPTGAHTKDGFETQLKNKVCSGTISLAAAQSEIGDHWVHAYYGIAPTADTSAGTPAAGPSASAGAALTVTITSLPASVKHGANATLIALTSTGATCSVSVTYASGTVSAAAGLKPTRTAASTGKVTWTWKVGTSTKPGTSTATVSCTLGDDSGSASETFQVT